MAPPYNSPSTVVPTVPLSCQSVSLQDGQHTSLTLGTFCMALPNRLAQQLNRELTDLDTLPLPY